MVERLHRQLKAAIKCHDTSNWVEVLPIVLLGIRMAIKEDLNATAAEMVYGTEIRLPAEFFLSSNEVASSDFVARLRRRIDDMNPQQVTRHGARKPFIFKELWSSPHVFLRRDAIRGPSQPPYDGPFEVVERGDKSFVIRIKDRKVGVSIDRLKPAFVIADDLERPENSGEIAREVVVEAETRTPQNDDTQARRTPFTTRAGRRIRFPERFQAGFD
ncbi:hypothetical protein WN55_03704 [Dufourea novaeangliae]|uniref:Pro-Pol polyprotein n=1 Tax=Dufourea novaeangliae TaxID=178035 RepID=A0A154PIN7_DUFNO|nr:hypothetical protein WN55_03704 [Dufourea novaeangliae]